MMPRQYAVIVDDGGRVTVLSRVHQALRVAGYIAAGAAVVTAIATFGWAVAALLDDGPMLEVQVFALTASFAPLPMLACLGIVWCLDDSEDDVILGLRRYTGGWRPLSGRARIAPQDAAAAVIDVPDRDAPGSTGSIGDDGFRRSVRLVPRSRRRPFARAERAAREARRTHRERQRETWARRRAEERTADVQAATDRQALVRSIARRETR